MASFEEAVKTAIALRDAGEELVVGILPKYLWPEVLPEEDEDMWPGFTGEWDVEVQRVWEVRE